MTTYLNSSSYSNDTICAISTPQGCGGIAVIRVSGPQAINAAAAIWQGTPLDRTSTHTAHFGKIIDPHTGAIIDEAVVTIFRAPNSFTGEDTIEISCHGSTWIQQQILMLLTQHGARTAQPGEFTRRAFASGRMDLSQAEAVADLIASTSQAAHRVAMSQMRGNFRNEIENLRNQLLQFASLLELELDFSEEDVEFANRDQLKQLATKIQNHIATLKDSYNTGNAIKSGIPVAIIGETNVGKSTLLNALLHDDKAIVSDIHGTTRDTIEDTFVIAGTLYRFIDTAGIRDTEDTIEAIGIDRTFRNIDRAHTIIWIVDPTAPTASIAATAHRFLPLRHQQHLIAVINKTDIASPTTIEAAAKEVSTQLSKHGIESSTPIIHISAKLQTGTDQLQQTLVSQSADNATGDQVIITNARHYEALTAAHAAIARVLDGLANGISGDFISQDIRETLHHLSEITGTITTPDILQTIFSKFCIGK